LKAYPTLVHKLQSKFSFLHTLCSPHPCIGPANRPDLKSTFFLVLRTGIHPPATEMTHGFPYSLCCFFTNSISLFTTENSWQHCLESPKPTLFCWSG